MTAPARNPELLVRSYPAAASVAALLRAWRWRADVLPRAGGGWTVATNAAHAHVVEALRRTGVGLETLPRTPNRSSFTPEQFSELGDAAEVGFGSMVSAPTKPVLDALERAFSGGGAFTRDQAAAEAAGVLRSAQGHQLSPGAVAVRVGRALSELEKTGYLQRIGKDLNAQGRPMKFTLTLTGEQRAQAQRDVDSFEFGANVVEQQIAALEAQAPPPPRRPLSGEVYRPSLAVHETKGHKLPRLQRDRMRAAGYRVNPQSQDYRDGFNAAIRESTAERWTRATAERYLADPDHFLRPNDTADVNDWKQGFRDSIAQRFQVGDPARRSNPTLDDEVRALEWAARSGDPLAAAKLERFKARLTGAPGAPASLQRPTSAPGARVKLPLNEGDLWLSRDSRDTVFVYKQIAGKLINIGNATPLFGKRTLSLDVVPGQPRQGQTHEPAPELTVARIWREGRETDAALVAGKYLARLMEPSGRVHVATSMGEWFTLAPSLAPPTGRVKLTTLRTPKGQAEEGSTDWAVHQIREGLRKRSGKAWSVTRGRGTAYGWLTITSPANRLGPKGYITDAEAAELGQLLGLNRPVHHQGESVPSGGDFHREYVDRAWGRAPSVYGQRTWLENPGRSKLCAQGRHDFEPATGLCRRKGCDAFHHAGQGTMFGRDLDPVAVREALAREAATGQRDMFGRIPNARDRHGCAAPRATNPLSVLVLGNAPAALPPSPGRSPHGALGPRAANPPAGTPGVAEVRKHCQLFHGAPVAKWRVVEIDDGQPGVTEKAVTALGVTEATVYSAPWRKSNKHKGGVYEHVHSDHKPLEVYDPVAHLSMKLLDDGSGPSDWWRDDRDPRDALARRK